MRNIRLETVDGRSRIVVELERPGTFETRPARGSRAVMILNDVALPDKLERTLKSGAEGGAVRFVSSFRNDDGEVHMEAELDGATSEMIRQDGNKLIWEFAPMVDRHDAPEPVAAKESSARQPVASPAPRRPRSARASPRRGPVARARSSIPRRCRVYRGCRASESPSICAKPTSRTSCA